MARSMDNIAKNSYFVERLIELDIILVFLLLLMLANERYKSMSKTTKEFTRITDSIEHQASQERQKTYHGYECEGYRGDGISFSPEVLAILEKVRKAEIDMICKTLDEINKDASLDISVNFHLGNSMAMDIVCKMNKGNMQYKASVPVMVVLFDRKQNHLDYLIKNNDGFTADYADFLEPQKAYEGLMKWTDKETMSVYVAARTQIGEEFSELSYRGTTDNIIKEAVIGALVAAKIKMDKHQDTKNSFGTYGYQ